MGLSIFKVRIHHGQWKLASEDPSKSSLLLEFKGWIGAPPLLIVIGVSWVAVSSGRSWGRPWCHKVDCICNWTNRDGLKQNKKIKKKEKNKYKSSTTTAVLVCVPCSLRVWDNEPLVSPQWHLSGRWGSISSGCILTISPRRGPTHPSDGTDCSSCKVGCDTIYAEHQEGEN